MNALPEAKFTSTPGFTDWHGAMVEQIEEAAVRENHGLIYCLIGWLHLLTCMTTNYLIEVFPLQSPHRWPYLLPWVMWILASWATVRLVRGKSPALDLPLAVMHRRIWLMFFLLCGNVVGLNTLSGLHLLVFLPVLATLGSFAFAASAVLVSRRLAPAILVMFLTGLCICLLPTYGFVIYGVGWFVVLETLALVLLAKRRCWLNAQAPCTLPFRAPASLSSSFSPQGEW